jgi:hypothetical protein
MDGIDGMEWMDVIQWNVIQWNVMNDEMNMGICHLHIIAGSGWGPEKVHQSGGFGLQIISCMK